MDGLNKANIDKTAKRDPRVGQEELQNLDNSRLPKRRMDAWADVIGQS